MKSRIFAIITLLIFLLTGCALKPASNTESTAIATTEFITEAESETTTESITESENKNPAVFDLSLVPVYSGTPYAVINDNIPFFSDSDLSKESYEYYSDLDFLNRCGMCDANIGIDIMPTEERGSIGNIKPSGWNQNKYNGLVDGNYLYNRCHLIGFQLTGENDNPKNLITGTRYLNTEGMLPFENMVADYIKETGNHVYYRVTPIFEDDNLLASGVLMEAKSVEDNGEDILFCVYCYNVQPGIVINYDDGSNFLPEDETPTTEAPTSAGICWKSATGSKYHSINNCGTMNPNKATKLTIEEAKSLGLEACKNCW